MSDNIFYRLGPLMICLVLMGVLLVAVEIGFWVKRGRVKGGSDSIEKADIALIVGGSTDTAGALAWIHRCDVRGPF